MIKKLENLGELKMQLALSRIIFVPDRVKQNFNHDSNKKMSEIYKVNSKSELYTNPTKYSGSGIFGTNFST